MFNSTVKNLFTFSGKWIRSVTFAIVCWFLFFFAFEFADKIFVNFVYIRISTLYNRNINLMNIKCHHNIDKYTKHSCIYYPCVFFCVKLRRINMLAFTSNSSSPAACLIAELLWCYRSRYFGHIPLFLLRAYWPRKKFHFKNVWLYFSPKILRGSKWANLVPFRAKMERRLEKIQTKKKSENLS